MAAENGDASLSSRFSRERALHGVENAQSRIEAQSCRISDTRLELVDMLKMMRSECPLASETVLWRVRWLASRNSQPVALAMVPSRTRVITLARSYSMHLWW